MADDNQPDNSQNIARQFSQNPQGYVSDALFAERFDLARAVELVQPQPDWSVLDVATGGGHTALAFAAHVQRVVAIDLTPAMLDAARRNAIAKGCGAVEFIVGDAQKPDFADATFDVVTCRIAAHHFSDVPLFLRESHRVLKPGGQLVIIDTIVSNEAESASYVNAMETLRDPSHQRNLSGDQWQAAISDAGFAVTHYETFIESLPFVPWVERQACSETVVEQLRVMFLHAPGAVRYWLQPTNIDQPDGYFYHHYAIIQARR